MTGVILLESRKPKPKPDTQAHRHNTNQGVARPRQLERTKPKFLHRPRPQLGQIIRVLFADWLRKFK